MGILKTNVVQKANGDPVDLTGQQGAKVWAHFDQNPSTVLNNSFNVSSLTDVGVGQTTLNLSSAYTSDEFPAVGSASAESGSAINYSHGAWLSSASAISFNRENSNGAAHDGVNLSVISHGDLA